MRTWTLPYKQDGKCFKEQYGSEHVQGFVKAKYLSTAEDTENYKYERNKIKFGGVVF